MGVDFFFFKQKTAYEMRISDWSSDVCSSDLSISVEMPVNRRWSVDGLVEAPLVDQGNDLVLITKLVGIDRAVMTTQIDEPDGHVGGDRMVDADQVREIKPAIVLRIPPGETEVDRNGVEKGKSV